MCPDPESIEKLWTNVEAEANSEDKRCIGEHMCALLQKAKPGQVAFKIANTTSYQQHNGLQVRVQSALPNTDTLVPFLLRSQPWMQKKGENETTSPKKKINICFNT